MGLTYFHVLLYSKRTITPTKKVTKEDFQKSKEDIEEIFGLFRDFVKENRPKLDIDKVATGETWFGTAALDLKLCTFTKGCLKPHSSHMRYAIRLTFCHSLFWFR